MRRYSEAAQAVAHAAWAARLVGCENAGVAHLQLQLLRRPLEADAQVQAASLVAMAVLKRVFHQRLKQKTWHGLLE